MARFAPLLMCLVLIGVMLVGESPAVPSTPATAIGPLRRSVDNPRYFATPDGRPVLLTGAHTWQNLQDTGRTDPPGAFDYPGYLDFLQRNNHNFFRLWTWEQARFSNEIASDDYFTSPMPYARTGAGRESKFNLDTFEPAYFDRMRQRVVQAGQRGIYVSVMLFNGWSIESCKGQFCENNPWRGHPFNKDNNVNGVDGDLNGNNSGEETHTLAVPAVTARQEAYVRKVVDTVGDLDNVLYEISNESPGDSVQWQYHMIEVVRTYERGRGKVHPIGMTSAYPGGDNADLRSSPADWISPNGDIENPPVTDGTKVVLSDTDHLCGLCGDSSWPWRSFTRGENPIYMDPYDGAYGIGGQMDDSTQVAIRANLGTVRAYAASMDLRTARPQPELCSTGYCLAGPREYLVFSPGKPFTVSVAPGSYDGQWLDPKTNRATSVPELQADRGRQFTPPFSGPAVLYLKQR
ncbi:hypothetical protein [Kibdelosporangium phytohabitans]|uniref:DUF4038 domain-containing protein n=1 Tax=Kibdelosporangium phytohabitans TaxID=860235 RepID=A0A0N9I5V6_9PSEU|nr:hypothetical protein [Kibdelosporangium phytohabitans]ALG11317.1 hypothetical protein AOZ06_34545 [Kibdelosporangium phytohabitans]MBE1462620.1 hypothetical protein [Kibdelosporangium phytohabitans]